MTVPFVPCNSTMSGACFPASKNSNTLGHLGKKNQPQTTNYAEKHTEKKFVRVEIKGLLPLLRKSCQSSQHRIPEVETASGFPAPGAQDCCCTQGVLVLTAQDRSRSAKLHLQAGTALAPAVECVS